MIWGKNPYFWKHPYGNEWLLAPSGASLVRTFWSTNLAQIASVSPLSTYAAYAPWWRSNEQFGGPASFQVFFNIHVLRGVVAGWWRGEVSNGRCWNTAKCQYRDWFVTSRSCKSLIFICAVKNLHLHHEMGYHIIAGWGWWFGFWRVS